MSNVIYVDFEPKEEKLEEYQITLEEALNLNQCGDSDLIAQSE